MAKLKTSLDQWEGLKVKIDGEVSSWELSFDECRDSALREVENREVRIGELSKEKAALDGEKMALAEKEAKLKRVAQKMKAELLRGREEDRNRSEDSLNPSSLNQLASD